MALDGGFGGATCTPSGEEYREDNHVIRMFTFERHQIRYVPTFYPSTTDTSRSPAPLWLYKRRLESIPEASDYDIERLRKYQAFVGLRTFATSWEAREALLLPSTADEAWNMIEATLTPCTMQLPERLVRGRCRQTGQLIPAPPQKKRRASDSVTEWDRTRWRLRQALLTRWMEESYARGENIRNEAAEARRVLQPNRSPGGRDYSGWCSTDQSQPDDDSVFIDLEPVAPLPVEPTEGGAFMRDEDTDELLREVDLLCDETLDPPTPPEVVVVQESPIVIDSEEDEDEGVAMHGSCSLFGSEREEDGPELMFGHDSDAEPEGHWYDMELPVLKARWNAAEDIRRREARLLKGAHRALAAQRDLMRKTAGRSHWRFTEACSREDRLRELEVRLRERKRAYGLACEEADGLGWVLEAKRERTDYDPVAEAACAASLLAMHDGEVEA